MMNLLCKWLPATNSISASAAQGTENKVIKFTSKDSRDKLHEVDRSSQTHLVDRKIRIFLGSVEDVTLKKAPAIGRIGMTDRSEILFEFASVPAGKSGKNEVQTAHPLQPE